MNTQKHNDQFTTGGKTQSEIDLDARVDAWLEEERLASERMAEEADREEREQQARHMRAIASDEVVEGEHRRISAELAEFWGGLFDDLSQTVTDIRAIDEAYKNGPEATPEYVGFARFLCRAMNALDTAAKFAEKTRGRYAADA